MRNETVERIVNLLFQDVEMTDEVQALYDETMSNCQERYQDMTSRGLSDDDAIAAVVESLKGMEDVISQYPKKSESPEAEEAPKSAEVPVDDGGDGEQTDFTFHPADIGRIEMTMVCDDVHLEESPDDDLHVLFEDVEGAKASICRIEDGVLRVCRDPDAPKRNRSSFSVSGTFANGRLYVKKPNGEYFFFGDEKSDNQAAQEAEAKAKEFQQNAKSFAENMTKLDFSGKTAEADDGRKSGSFEDMVNSFASTASRFGQELGKLFSSIKPNITVSRSIGDVTLCIPRIFDKPISVLTTSGDIEARDIHVTDLNFTSTSGDISVELFAPLNRGAFTTTSGDINIEADANDMQISTVSGDVEIHGDYDHLKFASTSGDVELEAKVRQCDFSSVSGDLDLRFTDALSLINGSTTSGDIDVELPDDTGMNNIDVHSRSGDISMRRSGRRGSRTVTGSIRSVSGDIEIH